MENKKFICIFYHYRYLIILLVVVVAILNKEAKAQSNKMHVGMYGIWAYENKDEAFKHLSTNDFSIASGVGGRNVLDKANRYGVRCLVGIDTQLTEDIANNEVEWIKYLGKIFKQVTSLKNHPGVFAWYFLDEPSWHKIPVDKVKDLYCFVKKLDGVHPVYTVLSTPDSWSEYLPYFDIVAVNPYLKSGINDSDSEMEVVSRWLAKMRADLSKVKGNKPAMWVVLGAFEERSRISGYKSPFKKPSAEEFNKMVRLALNEKIDGIMIWTLAFKKSPKYYDWNLPSDDPKLWEAVKKTPMLVREYSDTNAVIKIDSTVKKSGY